MHIQITNYIAIIFDIIEVYAFFVKRDVLYQHYHVVDPPPTPSAGVIHIWLAHSINLSDTLFLWKTLYGKSTRFIPLLIVV